MSSAVPIPSPIQPDKLRRDLDLSRERMARLADVSAKTIERWEERQTLPQSARVRIHLAQIQQMRDLGLSVYTLDGFRLFLRTPLPDLGGRTPLQVIEQGTIEAVIGALSAGYEGLGF